MVHSVDRILRMYRTYRLWLDRCMNKLDDTVTPNKTA
jgi:hypothetical protein